MCIAFYLFFFFKQKTAYEMRISDWSSDVCSSDLGNDKRLFEKEMAAGETYTVPADAQNPQILTGRPQALRVTIGGKEVAPLGPADRTITDVGISAAALNARPAPAAPAGTQQQDGGR